MSGRVTADRPAAAETLLEIEALTVAFDGADVGRPAVAGLSLALASAEVVAIVGESGSGKSMTAMAVLGLLPANATATGTVRFRGADVLHESPLARRRRGVSMAAVFQDPVNALNPVLSIGFQLDESVRLAQPGLSRSAVRARSLALLAEVGISDPARRMTHYPHQLSGGQCQRVMIAMALAANPEVLVADEPTTGLDVTIQAEILGLLRALVRDRSMSVLLITHDMGVVADLADRVLVMNAGRVVETARVEQLFGAPKEVYTRTLLAAVPRLDVTDRLSSDRAEPEEMAAATLDVEGLVVEFGGGPLGAPRFRALDGIDLRVSAGEFVGLVGESGSGKSTLGRVAVGAIKPTAGTVRTAGTELSRLGGGARRRALKTVGMVFQNPAGSLDPRVTIGASIGETLLVHRRMGSRARETRVAELLDAVQLPAAWSSRFPHELSGGQRQRVSIARAIALEPRLLIADEPTSALDVSVQERVLELFGSLQSQIGFACLFISHDLAVVSQLCHRVVVMKAGSIVETGSVRQVLSAPEDPYTRRLVAASPVPDPGEQRRRREAGFNPPL